MNGRGGDARSRRRVLDGPRGEQPGPRYGAGTRGRSTETGAIDKAGRFSENLCEFNTHRHVASVKLVF